MIAEIALPLRINKTFDYAVPEKYASEAHPYKRVKINFNDRTKWGIITRIKKKSSLKRGIKPLAEILDKAPVFDDFYFRWAEEISRDYLIGIGEALELFIPPYLRRTFSSKDIPEFKSPAFSSGKFSWDFVFSEGESFFYKIRKRLENEVRGGRQILFIVPMVDRIPLYRKLFSGLTDRISILYSQQNQREFFHNWMAARSGQSRVVLSTRTGIFSVLPLLSLIVVSEEGDENYIQQEAPYYNLKDMALQRARLQDTEYITGGILPTMDTFHKLKEKIDFIGVARFEEREINVVQKTRIGFSSRGFYNKFVDAVLKNSMDQDKRVMVIYNRRGYSRFLYCKECGHVLMCPRCGISLIYQFYKKSLSCPRCDYVMPFPENKCQKCSGTYIKFSSWGLEKVQKEMARIFPGKTVERIDAQKRHLPGQWNILIATNIIFHADLESDVVIVLDAESFSSLKDFRFSEDLFRYLYRAYLKARSTLVVCTSSPDFYGFGYFCRLDIKGFYEHELSQRKILGFPPFGHIGIVTFRGKNKKSVLNKALQFCDSLKRNSELEIVEPHIEDAYKERDKFHISVFVKSGNIDILRSSIGKSVEKVKLSTIKAAIETV